MWPRRSPLLASYGVVARQATVTAAAGLRPDDLLFLNCASGELPNGAVVALSEFYSLNQALVPQHVVFEMNADELGDQHRLHAAHAGGRARMGFQLCIAGLGAQFTTLELIAEAAPDFLCLDPVLVANLAADLTLVEVVQLLVRFSQRTGSQLIATGVRDDAAASAAAAHRRGAVLRRGVRASGHAAAGGVVRELKGPARQALMLGGQLRCSSRLPA